MKRKTILRGISATTASLLAVTVTASTLMFNNAGMINQMLNLTTSKLVQSEGADAVDTQYYSQIYDVYGDDIYNKSAALKLEMDVASENIRQAEEGTVLLKNDNSALPLDESAKVTVFGNGSCNSWLHKRLSESYVDTIETMTFHTAMEKTFGEDHVNTVLADQVYSKLGQTSSSEVVEAPISDVMAYEDTWSDDYNDAAVVVITRWGEEDGETVMTWTDPADGNVKNYLGLSKNEEDLFAYLKEQKEQGVFKTVIAVINSDQMMELDWLEEYDVDACLLAGIPGVMGFKGVANIIAGSVNPSGRTVDTYAANSLSAPATVYAADNTQTWVNVDEVNETCEDAENNTQHVDYYTIYAEGIYVGYKYYETRYEDSVLNQGNAASAAGAAESSIWNYEDEVVYTFGHGLSYTTFEQKMNSVSYNSDTDCYEVNVTVTNTGDTAGKSVVEVYAQTPYGDYEKENQVEKSAVQIVGFEKTSELAPGESETVTVEAERYFLASYDENKQKGYILSAGDYYLAIGDNAHDALNNILAAKGKTAADGMDYDGDASKTYQWSLDEIDTESYRLAGEDGAEVTNRFDAQQLDSYGIDFTYLSRSDWEDTFPTEALKITATAEMMADLDTIDYETADSAKAVSEFEQDADTTVMFVTLKDMEWDDDNWDMFLNQLSVDEMLSLVADNTGAEAVESIALPAQPRGDDGCGIYQGTIKATGKKGMGWVSDVVTARTWDKESFSSRGYYLAAEAIFSGINELWYGGGNIHRTPFGGRNMQYYSEDGNFSYIVGEYEAASMQELGVNYGIKHLVCNDSEYKRESLATFVNEQALREEYLRAFEGAVTEGGALCIMTGFNRLGCTYVGVCEPLLTGVVKTEWAYRGHITTDAGGGNGYKGHSVEQLMAGIDYTCWSQDTSKIKAAIEAGDGDVLEALRLATKRNLYAASRTFITNGLSSTTMVVRIVPWWKTAMIWTALGLAVVTVVSGVWYAAACGIKRKEKKENGR